jgi:hypothetical protein
VTSNCAAVAPHRRFELRHRYTPHQAHRATSVLSAVAVQVLCANRWLRSGGDSCLASILRSNVDPWRWLAASFVRRTGSSMAIVSNFVDSAALLLREAPMAFFSAISASRRPLFIMRQSQPHGRLAMGRRAWPCWYDVACRTQGSINADGLGGEEIAEKEAIGASRKKQQGPASDLSGGAPWHTYHRASVTR